MELRSTENNIIALQAVCDYAWSENESKIKRTDSGTCILDTFVMDNHCGVCYEKTLDNPNVFSKKLAKESRLLSKVFIYFDDINQEIALMSDSRSIFSIKEESLPSYDSIKSENIYHKEILSRIDSEALNKLANELVLNFIPERAKELLGFEPNKILIQLK